MSVGNIGIFDTKWAFYTNKSFKNTIYSRNLEFESLILCPHIQFHNKRACCKILQHALFDCETNYAVKQYSAAPVASS